MLGNREDGFDLGTWLGRKQAFSAMAGRCSASDAQCLREIREKKLYRSKNLTWSQFCERHLGTSRRWADKTIRQLEEFGPAWFHLAAVTRITPDEFRSIAPAVSEEGIRHGGEVIALIPENAAKLGAAVEALRQKAEPDGPATGQRDEIARAARLLEDAVERISSAADGASSVGSRVRLQIAVGAAERRLQALLGSIVI